MTDDALDHLTSRLQTLESRCHRLRQGLLLLSLLAALGALVGWTSPDGTVKAQEVQATRFTLVDEDGGVRARFTASEEGPGIWLYDEHNLMRAGYALDAEGAPYLSFRDHRGLMRTALVLEPDGEGYLTIRDRKGLMRAALGVESTGEPSVTLRGPRALMQAALSVSEDGIPSLVLRNRKGVTRTTLSVDDDAPYLHFAGPRGATRTLEPRDPQEPPPCRHR